MLCKCASARVRAESSSGTVKHYISQKKGQIFLCDFIKYGRFYLTSSYNGVIITLLSNIGSEACERKTTVRAGKF